MGREVGVEWEGSGDSDCPIHPLTVCHFCCYVGACQYVYSNFIIFTVNLELPICTQFSKTCSLTRVAVLLIDASFLRVPLGILALCDSLSSNVGGGKNGGITGFNVSDVRFECGPIFP